VMTSAEYERDMCVVKLWRVLVLTYRNIGTLKNSIFYCCYNNMYMTTA